MSSASVAVSAPLSLAVTAPLSTEPMLEALRALAPTREDKPARTVVARDAPSQAKSDGLETQDTGLERADAAAGAPQLRTIRWVEPSESTWLLSIKNFGLTLASFGVYHFWARAEINRQIANAIEVDGKPLDYTGTGREAFISFVLGTAIATGLVALFLMMFMSGNGGGTSPTVEGIRHFRWQRLIISLPLMFLLGSIAYRKRHHILRRTWIGGQSLALTGWAWSYAWQHFWSAFLVPLTMGWAAPWRSAKLEARKISEMTHGGMRFHADGNLKGLYRAFAVVWFGAGLLYVVGLFVMGLIVGKELMAAINGMTLEPLYAPGVLNVIATIVGIVALPMLTSLLIYRKAWLEYQVSTIAFEGGRLRLSLPLGRFLALAYGGLLLSILSLGCFKPVARASFMRFLVEHISIERRN